MQDIDVQKYFDLTNRFLRESKNGVLILGDKKFQMQIVFLLAYFIKEKNESLENLIHYLYQKLKDKDFDELNDYNLNLLEDFQLGKLQLEEQLLENSQLFDN